MSILSDLRKSLIPVRQGIEQHRAALEESFKERHQRYMSLNGELRALREAPPHSSEVEALLNELLAMFLDKSLEEFYRLTGPFRAVRDHPENFRDHRKITLDMLSQNPMITLSIIGAVMLKEQVGRAAEALPWANGPSPHEREKGIAALERQIQGVSAEMDEITGLADSLGMKIQSR